MPTKNLKMSTKSLLVMISTALLTWVFATILCSTRCSVLEAETHNLQDQLALSFLSTSFASVSSSLRRGDAGPKKSESDRKDSDHSKPKKMWVDTMSEYNGPSRVFPKWDFEHNPFPCYSHDKPMLMSTKPASEGLLFQRPEKTGTTTMVGILMRLAHNRAQAMSLEQLKTHNITNKPFKTCNHRAMHGSAKSYRYHLRNRQKSFLFSLIRDPTAKAISRFFHFS